MAIYHLKSNGEPGRCKAFVGNCPFGGPEDHYLSKQDAIKKFELSQGGSFDEGQLRDALVELDNNELRIIDARLLMKAKELSEAQGETIQRIEAITAPLAIIRAAKVEKLIELSR